MQRQRYFRAFWLMGWLPFVLALAGFGFQVLLNSKKPPKYIAVGKVIASTLGKPFSPDASEQKRLSVETLESEEVHRRALERTRGLHPELKGIEVTIKATARQDSGIVNVVAVGDESIYTRVFLGAVIDETMALLQERRAKELQEKSLTEPMGIPDESIAVMERPAVAVADFPSACRGALPPVALGFGLGLLVALVSAFIAASSAADEPAQI
jgi:hypothetical protein